MQWQSVSLSDICNIFAGGDVPEKNYSKFKTNEYQVPIFANGEKNKGLYGYTNIERVSEPSITVSARGTIGYSEIRLEPFFPIVRLIVLTLKLDIVDLNFLKYVVQNINFTNSGSSIPQLTVPMIKDYRCSIPSITEQKRIVAILDQVFADIEKARAKTEKNLKNARDLFESYLQQVFSPQGKEWNSKTLEEVSLDFGRGKSKHRPRNDTSLYGGKYPFIQTGDVRNCEHIISDFTNTYNEKGLAQSKLWPKGTICITIAANIAETGILGFDSCFPDSIIGVVVNPKVTTVSYVEFLLQSFKAILQAQGKGSAQDNINMGTFENMKFPFPPLSVQKEIVEKLKTLMDFVQQLEEIYESKLSHLNELKKSILQKAFTGQLSNKKSQKVAA